VAKDYDLVSVGSGPALEIVQALQGASSAHRCLWRVLLLDLDPQALDRASRRILAFLAKEQVQCVRDNLFRLPHQVPERSPLRNADFIVCLGFLDYLNDDDAAAMVRLFWSRLKPHGQILVGSFSPSCQSRPFMEWIGNWYLHYRTTSQLAQMAAASGIPTDRLDVRSDPQGADLLLHAVKGP
jgi:hypothetical protein